MKLTRRQFEKLAAATALAHNTANAAPLYTGALDGFEGQVNPADFDTVRFGLRLYESAPRRLRFRATSRSQAETWQRELKAKVTELIGGLPSGRVPLNTRTLEVREFPDYRREKFVFESRPGSAVLGYLLLPKQARTPIPAVVCVPGHGRGVDDIIGINDQGEMRTAPGGYQFDFAIQVAQHGMAAVAIEPMGFGCRRDPANKKKGLGVKACEPLAGAALMLGQTLIAWRVWDVMRTIDWIESRRDLDPKRVGCVGISGGGTCTVFSSALEPRIKAAMVSGYLNTFRDSVMSISHCIDNYVPGILNWAEMYDIAGLIAPRPLFSEAGEQDPIFPIAASIASYQKVKEVYRVFGVPDNVDQETFPAPHSFWGKRGIPFLARHLGA